MMYAPALSNNEIKSRLFGDKTAQKLTGYKTLADLRKASHDDLLLAGLSLKEADTVYLTFEVSRRAALETPIKKVLITSSSSVARVFKEALQDLHQEQFWVMYLNRANKVIKVVCVSEGGITGTVADPRIILKKAISLTAVSLILCHNHPSGSLTPSKADQELTIKIQEAARFFDLKVLDHIIVSSDGYYSFADEGLI